MFSAGSTRQALCKAMLSGPCAESSKLGLALEEELRGLTSMASMPRKSHRLGFMSTWKTFPKYFSALFRYAMQKLGVRLTGRFSPFTFVQQYRSHGKGGTKVTLAA